jgi:hypothetical protein
MTPKLNFMKNPTNGLADDLRPQNDGRGPHISRNILLSKERVEGPSHAYCNILLYNREYKTLKVGPKLKRIRAALTLPRIHAMDNAVQAMGSFMRS